MSGQHPRRTFLAAAAGIGLAAVTRPARAERPEPAASGGGGAGRTLRWGIIGTGTRGAGTHVPVLKAVPGAEIAALCDVSEERLGSAAARAGKDGKPPATYDDYQKLLGSPDVDAVVIATPNLLHREMFLAAVQSGKHVLCEKPAGASPAWSAAKPGPHSHVSMQPRCPHQQRRPGCSSPRAQGSGLWPHSPLTPLRPCSARPPTASPPPTPVPRITPKATGAPTAAPSAASMAV